MLKAFSRIQLEPKGLIPRTYNVLLDLGILPAVNFQMRLITQQPFHHPRQTEPLAGRVDLIGVGTSWIMTHSIFDDASSDSMWTYTKLHKYVGR